MPSQTTGADPKTVRRNLIRAMRTCVSGCGA